MNKKESIYKTFSLTALDLPIFYSNPGGLRFELSTGGSYLHQFFTAHKKASEICEYLFDDLKTITLCVDYFGDESPIDCLSIAKTLKSIELWPTVKKEHWFIPEKEQDEDNKVPYGKHYISYEISTELLDNILWSNLSSDLNIQPSPGCRLHMFDFKNQIHIWPYDDRGMDIVGPNHSLLKKLYHKFKHYLLDYEIEVMRNTFEED